jgi:hypothetical protein
MDCRQDVPALALADGTSYGCPRCGALLCAPVADTLAVDDCTETAPASTDPPLYDSWEMDEKLRHIERVLQTSTTKNRNAEAVYRREAKRFDLPHASLPPQHVPAVRQAHERKVQVQSNRAEPTSGTLTWAILSLGITGFVCGGILSGWSLWTGRQELWTIGLPVALVGQIALLVGLVLQLDRLWRDNREAAQKLDKVDEQLHDLKTTTTLLGTSQGSAASVFYSHYAGGAGPQLLLTDLKSQIDLLAMKIAQDDR